MSEQRPQVNRRQILLGVGSSTTAVALAATAAAAGEGRTNNASDDTAAPATSRESKRARELDNIHGNIVSGFHQHDQAMIFVSIPDDEVGQAWISVVASAITSSADIETARERFRAGEKVPNTTWVNLALSHTGLAALGRSEDELRQFPRAFRAGMTRRARRVGDTEANAPSNRPTPYQERLDGIVIVGADDPDDLTAEIERQRALATTAGVGVVHVELGAARPAETAHERFGFRDNISQPGLRGSTAPENPNDEKQGIPGQDLLWPGESVLGYARQGGVGAGDEPGPVARSGPDWTDNGSYLVFRRLTQDVSGFRGFVADIAQTQGMSEELAGAKIVGRYKSGAPLIATGAQASDPGLADPPASHRTGGCSSWPTNGLSSASSSTSSGNGSTIPTFPNKTPAKIRSLLNHQQPESSLFREGDPTTSFSCSASSLRPVVNTPSSPRCPPSPRLLQTGDGHKEPHGSQE